VTGRIISTPDPMRNHRCDLPRAESYQRGTVWECDDCEKQYVVVQGAQYNEAYTAWRRLTEGNRDGSDH